MSNEVAGQIVHSSPRHVSIYLYLYLCLVLS
jgi:hypothetical protein